MQRRQGSDSTGVTPASTCRLTFSVSSASPGQFGGGVEELLVYVVSWVGISVAVVCLATCLTTLCCQGAPWHTDHSTIHCNLWANLLVTELLFLVGANKTQYTVSASVSDRRKQTVIVKVQP